MEDGSRVTESCRELPAHDVKVAPMRRSSSTDTATQTIYQTMKRENMRTRTNQHLRSCLHVLLHASRRQQYATGKRLSAWLHNAPLLLL